MVFAAARPGLFPRAKTRTGWIGVDVGAGAVKLAQLEFRGNCWRLAETALIPWPEPAPPTAQGLAGGRLAGVIRRALAASGNFRRRDAACVLSPTATELVSLEVPSAPEPEQYDMIAQELAAHRDGASDDVTFDYWPADPSVATSEAGVVALNVLGIRCDLAEQTGGELDAAGLCCRGLDGAPFTLARAVSLAEDATAGAAPVAILDWGHSSALFAVISEGQPVFTRILRNCGCAGIAQAVQTALGLAGPEAWHLLSTCGVSSLAEACSSGRQDLPEFVSELLEGPIEEILGELNKTLSFLKHQSPGLAPHRLWLAGGGAAVKNIGRHLEAGLGLPVRHWRPWAAAPADGSAGDDPLLPVELFANAAALSLPGDVP